MKMVLQRGKHIVVELRSFMFMQISQKPYVLILNLHLLREVSLGDPEPPHKFSCIKGRMVVVSHIDCRNREGYIEMQQIMQPRKNDVSGRVNHSAVSSAIIVDYFLSDPVHLIQNIVSVASGE